MKRLYQAWPLLLIVSVSLFLTLYLSSPNSYEPRSSHQLWDLGHLALFFCISAFIFTYRGQQLRSYKQESIETLLYPLLLGIVIEILQPYVGRTGDVADVAKNFSGSLLAFAFFSAQLAKRSSYIGLTVRVSTLMLCLGISQTYIFSVYDEWQAEKQFPLLSNFESGLELSRFAPIGRLSSIAIDKQHTKSGEYALAIVVAEHVYSGASLNYFPRDWQNFQALRLSIYQEKNTEQSITVRLHDQQHPDHAYEFSDRYNQSFVLSQGWNDLEIDLETVKHAPKDREMDMANIVNLSVFMIKPAAQTLWLDHIYLK